MKRSQLAIVAVLLLAFGSAWTMPNGTRSILLRVIPAPPISVDSKLDRLLIQDLTRKEDVRVQDVNGGEGMEPSFPEHYFDLDSLVNWGQEIGGNYLMLVDVSSERIERRKSFSLPLIFHKYETVGIIEGEFRFVDLRHGKLLSAEPFKVEERGAQILQASMDDDINDPALHLTAVRKLEFMDKLEAKLSKQLTRRAHSLMSGW
jgi:hypothetical protein